jgi:hypothetical protein
MRPAIILLSSCSKIGGLVLVLRAAAFEHGQRKWRNRAALSRGALRLSRLSCLALP